MCEDPGGWRESIVWNSEDTLATASTPSLWTTTWTDGQQHMEQWCRHKQSQMHTTCYISVRQNPGFFKGGGSEGGNLPPPPPKSDFAPLRWAMINSSFTLKKKQDILNTRLAPLKLLCKYMSDLCLFIT